METFVIEQFVGQMNNPPEGTHTAPTKLQQLEFSRMGGYRPFPRTITRYSRGAGQFSTGEHILRTHDDGGLALFHHHTIKPATVRVIDSPRYRIHDVEMFYDEPYLVEGVGVFDYFRPVKPYIVNAGNNIHRDGPKGVIQAVGADTLVHTSGLGQIGFSLSQISGDLTPSFWRVLALHFVQTPGGLHAVAATTHETTGFTGTAGFRIKAGMSKTYREQYGGVTHIYLKGDATGGDYVLAGTATMDEALDVTDVPLGPILPTATNALLLTAPAYTRAVSHQGRYYWPLRALVNIAMTTERQFGPETLAHSVNERAAGENIVAFSEPGYTNLSTPDSWFPLNFQSGGEMTGMASTPAGLLIFSKGETQLLVGDPTAADAELKRMSSIIGHDYKETPPARLGGAVFCISGGRVYQIALGMGDVDFGQGGVEDISAPVFDPERPFVHVVADAKHDWIVAKRLMEGYGQYEVLIYDVTAKQWVFWHEHQVGPLLPASGNGGWDGVAAFTDTARTSLIIKEDVSASEGGPYYNPILRYDNLDLGTPDVVKSWRSIEVHFDQPYDGSVDVGSILSLRIAPHGGAWQEYDKPLMKDDGRLLIFKLNRKLVARRCTLEFTINSFAVLNYTDVRPILRPPITIYYEPRRRER